MLTTFFYIYLAHNKIVINFDLSWKYFLYKEVFVQTKRRFFFIKSGLTTFYGQIFEN